ncbi:hypothetical protein XELAEV_18031958mg [Xenopus laevis]|uniref:Uncharacterized protein n=1 Tax=Xenopus laevis TaxID=8355 RepID=A0A974HG45_XENLA|nr:hypothetical protein XELAEV_18031958mg [Xenopus laevis]
MGILSLLTNICLSEDPIYWPISCQLCLLADFLGPCMATLTLSYVIHVGKRLKPLYSEFIHPSHMWRIHTTKILLFLFQYGNLEFLISYLKKKNRNVIDLIFIKKFKIQGVDPFCS